MVGLSLSLVQRARVTEEWQKKSTAWEQNCISHPFLRDIFSVRITKAFYTVNWSHLQSMGIFAAAVGQSVFCTLLRTLRLQKERYCGRSCATSLCIFGTEAASLPLLHMKNISHTLPARNAEAQDMCHVVSAIN